jgi:D-3-phosphoglycerate dehydrogenase
MEVWGYDPYVNADDLKDSGIIIKKEIPEILVSADIISLHVPLTEETRGLMGESYFSLMKPNAFIVNTSRGEVIQETALVAALKTGRIAGAGLDVFETEPPDADNPLFDFENVILTPHSAALTKDVVAGLAKGSAENAINALAGREPSYSPNWEIVREQK